MDKFDIVASNYEEDYKDLAKEIFKAGMRRGYEKGRIAPISAGEKKTNGDRIRAMTDEELADELLDWFAAFYAVEWKRETIIERLKEPADND